MLSRDHKEVLSEKLRTALMISILPQGLQERVAEHLDRFTTYHEVHDKIVGLVQASSRYSASDAMDCSAVDKYAADEEEADINALPRNHCDQASQRTSPVRTSSMWDARKLMMLRTSCKHLE